MRKKQKGKIFDELPHCAAEFIHLVVKLIRYRRNVRDDVGAELAAHFEDALKDCRTDEEKEEKAQRLIDEFGDAKLLAVLTRRAKKRCRPLWRTIAARTLQAVGVFILCFTMYTAWFLTGKPNVSIDYMERWNELSKPKVITGDNAWVNYEKAIDLFTGPDESIEEIIIRRSIKLSDLNELEQKKITEWIEGNEAAWNEFVKGSLRSYYYRKVSYSGDPNDPYHEWLLNLTFPHLHPLRRLGWLGIWRSRIAAKSGKTRQALEDCLTIIRVGSHLQSKGGLIEQLVGMAITRLGYERILAIMAEQKLSATTLAELDKKIREVHKEGYPEIDMESERLFLLDTVQRLFTDGGPGGGHLTPSGTGTLINLYYSNEMSTEELRIIAYTGSSMIHARRNETIDQCNKMYDKMAEIVKMSPYEKRLRQVSGENILSDLPMYRYFLLSVLKPSIDRISQVRYEVKAYYEAVLTLLALKYWQMNGGNYPAQLQELVARGYLERLPIDPYSDKPLVYKRTDDGFTLYSVGPNFIDDNGLMGRDRQGRAKMWAENGDAVFWPVTEYNNP